MQSIYVIGRIGDPFKIGYSSDPAKRLAAIQTGHPKPLSVLASAETQNAREHENALHKALEQYRLSGEWYHCSLETAVRAMTDLGLDVLGGSGGSPAWMSAPNFSGWLEEMAKPPFFQSAAGCAALLGVTEATLNNFRQNGADRRTALACTALLHRMEPYGSG